MNATSVPTDKAPSEVMTQPPPTPQMSIVPQVTKKLTMKGNAVEMRALRFATSSHAVLYCLKDSPLRDTMDRVFMAQYGKPLLHVFGYRQVVLQRFLARCAHKLPKILHVLRLPFCHCTPARARMAAKWGAGRFFCCKRGCVLAKRPYAC